MALKRRRGAFSTYEDMVPFCRKVFNSHRHPDITAVVEQYNRKKEDTEKLLERQVRHSAEHLLK